MAEQKSLRAVAKHVTISTLYLGKYLVQQENSGSALQLDSGEEIIRVNIVGTIVMREDLGSITVLKIDDGRDSINLRFFDSPKALDVLQIGNVILVVGRLREYNSERYVAVEIAKKVSPRWLKYRSLLLQLNTLKNNVAAPSKPSQNNEELVITEKEKSELSVPAIPSLEKNQTGPLKPAIKQENPYLDLMALIEKLDGGPGVAIEIVISESGIPNTKELLQKMMESGDIFQNMPGKVKVL